MAHPRPDIAFSPTPSDAVAAMLSLADLTPADRVYDLGGGDGRLLIQAASVYCLGGGAHRLQNAPGEVLAGAGSSILAKPL